MSSCYPLLPLVSWAFSSFGLRSAALIPRARARAPLITREAIWQILHWPSIIQQIKFLISIMIRHLTFYIFHWFLIDFEGLSSLASLPKRWWVEWSAVFSLPNFHPLKTFSQKLTTFSLDAFHFSSHMFKVLSKLVLYWWNFLKLSSIVEDVISYKTSHPSCNPKCHAIPNEIIA